MILPAKLAHLVLAGQKTEHRIPLRKGDSDRWGIYQRHKRGNLEVIQPAAWVPYDPAWVRAVVPDGEKPPAGARPDGRGGWEVMRRLPGTRRILEDGEVAGWERLDVREQIGRVVFTADPVVEPLELMDDDRARAEGFGNFGEWIDHWEQWHRKYFDPDELVRVIRFRLDREGRDRIPHRQSDYAPSADSPPGYTTNPGQALPGEPAAVPREWQQRHSELRRNEFKLIKRDDTLRELARGLGVRMRQETLAAAREGADITPELREIERQLAEVERKRRENKRQRRVA